MDQKFKFSCQPGLECFGSCCRNINIFLTPFDVLRMKKKLGLNSGQFLSRYTMRKDEGFLPLVIIRMREDKDLACPFVSEKGCQVYDVRPWSCRIAPVDLEVDGYSFIFDSNFCHGLNKDLEWTVDEWMENQGMAIYEEKEKVYEKIPATIQLTGLTILDKHIKDVVYMASYDLDGFRQFIFETRFLRVFPIPLDEVEKIKHDDEALLQYSFNWLLREFDVSETMDMMEELY